MVEVQKNGNIPEWLRARGWKFKQEIIKIDRLIRRAKKRGFLLVRVNINGDKEPSLIFYKLGETYERHLSGVLLNNEVAILTKKSSKKRKIEIYFSFCKNGIFLCQDISDVGGFVYRVVSNGKDVTLVKNGHYDNILED